MIPQAPLLTSILIFSLVSLFEIFFCLIESPHEWDFFCWNFGLFTGAELQAILGIASIVTIIVMTVHRPFRKSTLHVFAILMVFSLGAGIWQDMAPRIRISRFFNNQPALQRLMPTGRITSLDSLRPLLADTRHYHADKRRWRLPSRGERCVANERHLDISPDGNYEVGYDPPTYARYLINRKTNHRIFTLRHWVMSAEDIQWFRNSRILAYEYNYDNDDPVKVFAANVETGETILLGGRF